MKIFLFCLYFLSSAWAQDFETEAKALAQDLKTNLMENLSQQIAKKGVTEAIPFCHKNVQPIAKAAAKDRIHKYAFGRTSHKIRNPKNQPEEWMKAYLDKFKGQSKNQIKEEYIVHTLGNSKRVYLEPLYVQAKCLFCHGENISSAVQSKINQLYPKDKATGFKLGEFRGFIWVKER